jgi:hypothetical protein
LWSLVAGRSANPLTPRAALRACQVEAGKRSNSPYPIAVSLVGLRCAPDSVDMIAHDIAA